MAKTKKTTRSQNPERVDEDEVEEGQVNLEYHGEDNQEGSRHSDPHLELDEPIAQPRMRERMDRMEAMMTKLLEYQMKQAHIPGSTSGAEPAEGVNGRTGFEEADHGGPNTGLGRSHLPLDKGKAINVDDEPDQQGAALGRSGPPQVDDPVKQHPSLGRSSHGVNEDSDPVVRRHQNMAREMEMMSRRIDELSREHPRRDEVEVTNRHPFSMEIMSEPLPHGFTLPSLETYDGTEDPVDHLQNFDCSLALHGIPDAIMCRAFPSTLKGVARAWYTSLRPSSISGFTQLGKAFITHFASSRRRRRTSTSLMSLRQEVGERTRDYLARFNSAAVEVPDLDQAIAVAAVMNGLRPSRLTFSLFKSPPDTLSDLMRKADKYMRAEEGMSARKDEEGEDTHGKKRRRMEDRQEEKRKPRGSEGPQPPTPRRFERYTTLNRSRERILELEKNKGWIRFPGKLRSNPETRDKKKYCKFHQDHGHDTEECINLKDTIEEEVRRGHLRDYAEERRRDERRSQRDSTPRERGKDHAPNGVINVISGGHASGGESSRARKAYARGI